MTGLFITFEGVDGAGKTTQAALVAEAFRRSGRKVLQTREPGGTPVSEAVRRLLLDPQYQVDPLAEVLLYEAARAQLVAEVIRPALEAGEVVICDRFIDSTLAYQGYGRGMDCAMLELLNDRATAGLRPQVTLVLDVNPREGQARTGQRPADRMELAGYDFQVRVQQGFRELAAKDRRLQLIEAGGAIAQVHRRVIEALRPWAPELLPAGEDFTDDHG
ncbi:dTMP kinase [Heliophilum fasciatum]|uniref:Thymidylate kinase n=1 Tax=Heliophilum fasciatum TaxID=35700 RepID=A0A4R2SBB1_9FIRM|nr:dTMP kinase [Heliophilum fasciatum]MCW2276999.1 dTMP kinase [Heliophilum fasciatum]TCP68475.1 thymidylate kinase [Heliophilum fasciatum]